MSETNKPLTVTSKLAIYATGKAPAVLIEITEPNNIAVAGINKEQADKLVGYLINHFDLHTAKYL